MPDAATSVRSESWTQTDAGEPRGYIQPGTLSELWFHTGTTCNLRCPFCLEAAGPGDQRIQAISLADAKPFIEESLALGVQQFSFTGGEPFVVPEFIDVLRLALQHRPCLVLTNGTEPLFNRLQDVLALRAEPHPLCFRISLDFADEKRHDAGRGRGNFRRSIAMLKTLHDAGFEVSVARHRAAGEDVAAEDQNFRAMLVAHGLPGETPIVSFPEFLRPFSQGQTPAITESCMTTHHTEESRATFMCAYTKMVVKKGGRMRVYACTLVDDDEDYDLGGTLTESMAARVMMKHHRCFSCFAHGASCSEPTFRKTSACAAPGTSFALRNIPGITAASGASHP
jgi:sulfatase maturation enzyme AslB (radical SAM superfamily)